MRETPRWTWLAVLASAVAALLLSGPLAAEQNGDDKAFEKNLDGALRDVINLGATLFNNQDDHAGCYRLFEGSLRSIKPLLGKYPDLQKKIDGGLANASTLPRMHDRAHALRKVLDEVRLTINPPAIVAKSTLWNRLGGEKGVDKVLSDFIGAAAGDPRVDFTRGGKYAITPQTAEALKKSLLDFVSSATGGPYVYKGPSMREVHKGMGITDEQFDIVAGLLKDAMEANGVKAEDIKAILGAVAGTRRDIVEQPKNKIEDKKEPEFPKKIEDKKEPELPKKIEAKKNEKKAMPPDPNLAQVHGRVTIEGKALTHGFVTFVNGAGQRFSANVQKDGNYVFRKGFPPGEYIVLLEDGTTPAAPGEMRLTIPLQYTAPVVSPLRYTAEKGENTHDIAVK